MPNLLDELRDLAHALAASDDPDVRDSADILCKQYRLRRMVATGMSAVDSMIADGPEIDENDPRLVAVREWFRDSLKELLSWARESGRVR